MTKVNDNSMFRKALGVGFSVLVVIAAIATYQVANKYLSIELFRPKAAEDISLSGCTDTDGGLNYETKGNVSLADDATQSTQDLCLSENGQAVLSEYYCKDGKIERSKYNCPTGCSNGACNQTVSSPPTLISPNGGERWQLGTTQRIHWDDSTVVGYALYATDAKGSAYGIIAIVPDGSLEYQWKVGDLGGGKKLAPGEYYIQVSEQVSGEFDQSNASFTVY